MRVILAAARRELADASATDAAATAAASASASAAGAAEGATTDAITDDTAVAGAAAGAVLGAAAEAAAAEAARLERRVAFLSQELDLLTDVRADVTQVSLSTLFACAPSFQDLFKRPYLFP